MKLVSVKGSFTIDTIFNCYEGDDIKEDEMAHGENAYGVLMAKPEGKRRLCRPTRRKTLYMSCSPWRTTVTAQTQTEM
jgi:hypothetical protein